jgi:hypothetical protein
MTDAKETSRLEIFVYNIEISANNKYICTVMKTIKKKHVRQTA